MTGDQARLREDTAGPQAAVVRLLLFARGTWSTGSCSCLMASQAWEDQSSRSEWIGRRADESLASDGAWRVQATRPSLLCPPDEGSRGQRAILGSRYGVQRDESTQKLPDARGADDARIARRRTACWLAASDDMGTMHSDRQVVRFETQMSRTERMGDEAWEARRLHTHCHSRSACGPRASEHTRSNTPYRLQRESTSKSRGWEAPVPAAGSTPTIPANQRAGSPCPSGPWRGLWGHVVFHSVSVNSPGDANIVVPLASKGWPVCSVAEQSDPRMDVEVRGRYKRLAGWAAEFLPFGGAYPTVKSDFGFWTIDKESRLAVPARTHFTGTHKLKT